MRFSFFALAAIVAAVPAQALIAYTGENCDGQQLNVTLDGRCYDGFNTFSIYAGTTACLRVYSHDNCQDTGQRFDYENLGDFCQVANHGMNTKALRAWASAECPPAFND